jgi:ammonia channel protein AmtB
MTECFDARPQTIPNLVILICLELAGVSGVVGSVILGPRKPDKVVRSETTVLMTFIGGSMLWVGWFGFNAGSALTAGTHAHLLISIDCSCSVWWRARPCMDI